jgi:hypothetical protein
MLVGGLHGLEFKTMCLLEFLATILENLRLLLPHKLQLLQNSCGLLLRLPFLVFRRAQRLALSNKFLACPFALQCTVCSMML